MAKRREKKKRSGSLMSMRSGFQSVVGVRKAPKRSLAWNVISWILVLALVAAAIFVLARRF